MNSIYYSLSVIFHPLDTFVMLKGDRRRYNYWPGITLLFLVLAARFIFLYNVHYPLVVLKVVDANIWLEFCKLMVPLLTWVISCYAVTSIKDGESFMREIFTAAAYSMVPYIIITLFLTVLSQFLSKSELGLFTALQVVMWIWVFALFFISVMTMNSYSFGRTVIICLISIIVMLLVWAVLLLIYALSGQLVSFVKGIMTEIKMLYLE